MKKEEFIRIIGEIQNYRNHQDIMQDLIEKISNGHSVITIGNALVEEIISLLNVIFNIEDEDLIYWWLTDEKERLVWVREEDGTVGEMYDLETSGNLYDYIIEFYGVD